ncbi:MAG: dTMP kinase [bacterium]|nr:dTMP kinase [bacterium]
MNNTLLKGFIVIEGLDGAGTTTQLNNISNYLSDNNIKHYRTFEPTDNEIGKFIRNVLSGKIPLEQETIAYLFSADRNEHIYGKNNGIIKQLEEGNLVICDRYLFSSIAYQSIGIDPELVFSLNSKFPLPEYLIFIDVPVEICQERLKKRNSEIDIYDNMEYQKKVLDNYTNSIDQYLDSDMKVIKIDGLKVPENITREIIDKIFSV